MKNYAFSEDEKGLFIKNYIYDDDKIIVNYGDGSSCSFSNDVGNEIELLRVMKKQVLESDDFFSRTKYLLKLCRLGMLSVFLVGSILTLLTIPFAKSIIDLLVVELASLLFVSPAFITFFRGIKMQKEILKDIKKNRLFVQNEMLFQVNLVDDIKLNKKISDNTKKEVESIIKLNNSSINEITHPTVNDIDNVSYKTILELYDVLKNSDSKIKKRVLKKINDRSE